MILPGASSSESDIGSPRVDLSNKGNHRARLADELRPAQSSERVYMRYSGFSEFGKFSPLSISSIQTQNLAVNLRARA